MKTYQVYVKSHCEAPDFESEFDENQLKGGFCLIPYMDDVDEDGHGTAIKCGGKLIPLGEGGLKCTGCGQIYEEEISQQ